MKKSLFIVIVALLIISGIAVVTIFPLNKSDQTNKLSIVTTLFPLYDFSKNIGGEKVEVLLLLPPGVEAHTFEPKPRDITQINEADLFVYTGRYMEPWAEAIVRGISNQQLVVDASLGTQLLPSKDPHIWLDFDNVKIIVDNIFQAMVKRDPLNAKFYQKNATRYKNQLTELDKSYQTALKDCQSREIYSGGHSAFAYLARRYHLQYQTALGISPDAEPTVDDLIQIINKINRQNRKYIFFEELASPKISETIAAETGAKMLLLNAGHNISKKDFKNKVSFLTIMENNLTNLSIGLGCSH